jgi:16S rRNA (cytosine967-C5)-methyltransferase
VEHRAKPGRDRRTPAVDARGLAWEILRRVEVGGAYADALIGQQLGASGLSNRDRGLVTRLVYGTIAWQGYLDHLIAAFARRAPEQLDPPVRVLLRLGMFQIALLTKVPAFAAVDTAVQLAKRFRSGAATGLVNAVLRRAAAAWRAVPFPPRDTDCVGYLAVRLSHPRWLVERWVAQYGVDETEALLRANNEPAPTVVRVNRSKAEASQLVARLRDEGCVAEPGVYSPVAIRLELDGSAGEHAAYRDGLFSLQGEASQLVGFLSGVRPGDRVLDVCAAPGGKTTHLGELMDDAGTIIAFDAKARGIRRLRSMTQRLGLSCVHAAVTDFTRAALGEATFDCVLVDAPCSGLGTLREHPEVKWRRTPAMITALTDLQRRLLLRAADCVRPGGALIYSTCTISAEENEGMLASFRQAHPAFVIDDARALLPESARLLAGDDGILRTFPHRHGLDGFFAVRLVLRSGGGRG